MNRKIVSLFFILILTAVMIRPNSHVYSKEQSKQIIPEQAIRLRILANSDSIKDQALKKMVRDEVSRSITAWIQGISSKEEAARIITEHIPEIEEIVENVMEQRDYVQPYSIELGKTEFPTKLYGDIIYPAGTYDALKITLGKGTGANWWCVLYPPLCFLDFDSSSAKTEKKEQPKDRPSVQEDANEVEVRFFLVDIFKSIF